MSVDGWKRRTSAEYGTQNGFEISTTDMRTSKRRKTKYLSIEYYVKCDFTEQFTYSVVFKVTCFNDTFYRLFSTTAIIKGA